LIVVVRIAFESRKKPLLEVPKKLELAKDKPVKQEKYVVYGKYQYIVGNRCP